MTALIAKRNNKFHSAVSDLIVACASHNPPLDPVELLLEATAEHLPVHPDELVNDDDIREKGVKEKQEELGFYERNPDHRKSIATIIDEITSEENDWYEGQIVEDGHRTFEAREAIYGKLMIQNLTYFQPHLEFCRWTRSSHLGRSRFRASRNKEHRCFSPVLSSSCGDQRSPRREERNHQYLDFIRKISGLSIAGCPSSRRRYRSDCAVCLSYKSARTGSEEGFGRIGSRCRRARGCQSSYFRWGYAKRR